MPGTDIIRAMSLEGYRITVSLIDALAWPVAVGVAASVFLWRYREPLSAGMRRVVGFSTPLGGVTLGPPEQQTLPDGTVAEAGQQSGSASTALGGTEDATNLRALAEHYERLWRYETIYRAIFGTQMQMLENANDLVPQSLRVPVTEKLFRDHEEAVHAQFPTYATSFPAWVGFLMGHGLLQAAPDGYVITPLGQDFLTYLARNGLSRVKPF